MRPMNCQDCPNGEKVGKVNLPLFKFKRPTGEYASFIEVGGFGNATNPEIVVVTDGPTIEDLRATPVITGKHHILNGEQGTTLSREFADHGFDGNQAYYLPAHRCHLTHEDKQDKKKVKKVLDCCHPYVDMVLKHLSPKMILTLGDAAFKQVLNQTGITKRRGMLQFSETYNCWVLPTFSVGYCLRDQKNFARWRPDIAQMFQFIRNGYTLTTSTEADDYRDVESIQFIIDNPPAMIGLDTETQGAEFADPNSVVISYSISTQSNNGYNIWLATECEQGEHDLVIKWPRKVAGGRKQELVDVYVQKADRYEEKIEELRQILSNPNVKKCMMNGNYELHRFRQLGIERSEIKSYTMDIQAIAHTLDPDNNKKLPLQQITAMCDSSRMDHKSAFAQEVDKSDMLAAAKENPPRHTAYAAKDAADTLHDAYILKDRLMEDTRLAEYYVKLVHPVTSELFYEIEKNGVLFDMERLGEAKDEVGTFLQEQTNKFLALTPKKVLDRHRTKGLRLTRNDFIRDILFAKDGFNLRPLEKTPAGGDAIGRKLLVRMRDDLDDSHPAKELISTYIAWGPFNKLYSTYLKGFGECVFPDGRLHPQITKSNTATGRSAMARPNLQQIPKRNQQVAKVIRRLLIADPGYSFVTADASQAELRWIGARGQEEVLRDIYRNGGDVHTKTAEMLIQMGGHSPSELSPSELKGFRTKAKAINFGYCLVKGTEVITDKGIKPIEDVSVGDMVLTHKHRYRRVTDLQSPVATKLLKIKTKTGKEVVCTPDHMMLVHFPSANGRPSKQGFVPACDLVEGDYLVYHGEEMKESLESPITEDEARIIGWYMSEGSLSSGAFHISQSRTANSDICEYMDVILGAINYKQLKCGYVYSGNTKEMRRLLNLLEVDYKGKSYGMAFNSDAVARYPANIRRSLIAGLWDGDGCIVNKNGKTSINYSSASTKLLRGIQRVLDSLGLSSTIYIYPQTSTNVLHITGSTSIMHFMRTIPTLKRNGKLYEPKKQFSADERIVSISSYETYEQVYDFTVEEDHSFVANGLFTHNCFGMQSKKFQAYARDEYGVRITAEEAEAFRVGFFELYPGLSEWHRREIATAKQQWYVRTDYGFVRRLPNIHSQDFMKRSEDERAAINTPIQSASNDTVLFAALTAHRRNICEDKAKLVLFIHDELVYMVKDEFIPTFVPRLLECMIHPPIKEAFGIDFPIPFGSDVQVGKTLANLEEYKL